MSISDGLMVVAALTASFGSVGTHATFTIHASIHTSFTRGPSYLTGVGRSLIGGATVGSISVQHMTTISGDTIAAFAGPPLGVENRSSLNQVLARHPALRAELRIAPKLS